MLTKIPGPKGVNNCTITCQGLVRIIIEFWLQKNKYCPMVLDSNHNRTP